MPPVYLPDETNYEEDTNADQSPDVGVMPPDVVKRLTGEEPAGPVAGRTLEELPLADLRKMAAELDIAGRSSLERDELIEALREATTPG